MGEIRVGVSACLTGAQVRYDGGHKRNAFLLEELGRCVRFVPVCPEVGIDLGVPRQMLRLVRRLGGPRLIGAGGADHTEPMLRWALATGARLRKLDLSGFVLKKGSPSCGLERVRVWDAASERPSPTGRGVFAAALVRAVPGIAIEEEGRLNDPLRPVVWVLERSARILLRPFGVHEVIAGDSIRSPEELRALVDEAEGSGVIPRAQEEMLHNVFDFARREARDVMVPAPEVDWLDAELNADAALAKTVEHRRSRYPVASGSLDQLVGIVHIQKILAAARTDPGSPVAACTQPGLIVPETKDLGALLRELRRTRQQLAVVADEYGATAGIVTMEDILEEIVGEIEGEYELPDDTLTRVDDHTLLVAGSMTIDDFNEAVGTQLPQDVVRTMAGLVFSALGRRPRPDDTVTVGSTRLTVEQMDGMRITRLRVEPTPSQPPA
jgi:Mg2+/Co2+ transporter CorC/uncharacterized protein YbbK (DUF523 family)